MGATLITRLVKSRIDQMVDAALAKKLGDIDNLVNERIGRAI